MIIKKNKKYFLFIMILNKGKNRNDLGNDFLFFSENIFLLLQKMIFYVPHFV